MSFGSFFCQLPHKQAQELAARGVGDDHNVLVLQSLTD